MGISNLNKFLRGKCPEVFETINLSDLAYFKGAVDISLYVFIHHREMKVGADPPPSRPTPTHRARELAVHGTGECKR